MKLVEELYNFRIREAEDESKSKFEIRKFLSPSEKEKAKKWEDKSESEILKAAKKGDDSAINYIFLKSGPIIYKAFKTYTGPDSYYFSQAVKNGEYEDFIAEAYSLLKKGFMNRMGNISLKSPLETFKPDLFDEGDKVNKFKYYYLQYLKNMASSLKSEQDSYGVSTWDTDEVGNIKGKNEKSIKIRSTSLDADLNGSHDRGDADNGKYQDYVLDSHAEGNGSQYNLENEFLYDEDVREFLEGWKELTKDEKFAGDVAKCVEGLIKYPDLKAEDCAKKIYGTPDELGIEDWEFHNQYGLRFTNTLRKKLPKLLEKYGLTLESFLKAYQKRPDILLKYI